METAREAKCIGSNSWPKRGEIQPTPVRAEVPTACTTGFWCDTAPRLTTVVWPEAHPLLRAIVLATELHVDDGLTFAFDASQGEAGCLGLAEKTGPSEADQRPQRSYPRRAAGSGDGGSALRPSAPSRANDSMASPELLAFIGETIL